MNIFSKCDHVLASGINAVLATIIDASAGTPGKPGFKLLVTANGELFGTVGGGALENRAIEEARRVLETGRSRVFHFNMADLGMECGGSADLLIEFLEAVSPFVLFGGGHIGRALCPILQSIGFTVTVYDARTEITGYFKEKGAQVVPGDYNDINSHAGVIRSADYCIIATHGHEHDYEVLRQLLLTGKSFRYIGLIGSKRKVEVTVKRLEDEGVSIPPYVYTPIGLKTGAVTAGEIAVSIAAEVVAVKNNYKADHMRIVNTEK